MDLKRDGRVLVIAEIGINHNGDMDLAHKLIRQAKTAGADIAKFQLYDPHAIYGPHGIVPNPHALQEALGVELKRADVNHLFRWCAEEGIEFMASVCDLERVEWTEALGMRRYKIASKLFEDERLCETIIALGKETIISLGFWNPDVRQLYTAPNVRYLYCIPKYPTELSDMQLPRVFDGQPYAGFSDHTRGIEASLAAVARGATILERHITLNKSMPGPDHSCSLTPDELSHLIEHARAIATLA